MFDIEGLDSSQTSPRFSSAREELSSITRKGGVVSTLDHRRSFDRLLGNIHSGLLSQMFPKESAIVSVGM